MLISAFATSLSVLLRRSAMPYSVTTMSRRWRGIVQWP